MQLSIPKALAEKIGFKKLERYDVREYTFYNGKSAKLDMQYLNQKELAELRALIEANIAGIRNGKVILRDIDVWEAAQNGDTDLKARSVKQMHALLIELIRPSPGQRIYQKLGDDSSWSCYYCSRIEFADRRGEDNPAYVTMTLVYEEFGSRTSTTRSFYERDCVGRSAPQLLVSARMYLETEDLRQQYLEDFRRYQDLVQKIGLQCLASGPAVDSLDGNERRNRDRHDSWYRHRRHTIQLGGDEPDRVVIDVLSEQGDRSSGKQTFDPWFWQKKSRDDDPDNAERPEIEIPTHPFLAVFDLRRHLRLRIHVCYLQPYRYRDISDKLVLPEEVKRLVSMLLAQRGAFRDIIDGKSGGAIVMCAGVAGTGKTLTAEVYAESRERPLYSVQASQLGTDPDDLEDELLRVFARAQRWNAVLLIDEADVYVRARGDDLQQNAIVGVLLRVLEYYSGVLFLTTNRGDTIDDAVASRCMARIDYGVPEMGAQAQIWRILSETSGIPLEPVEIAKIVSQSPGLTGRDVKNLLKLAQLVSSADGKPITAETVDFVKQFRPTRGEVQP